MKKTIELTLEQAREMLGKDEAMDALIRANFTEQELKPKVKRWEDLGEVEGYFITTKAVIEKSSKWLTIESFPKTIFAKKTQAEGVLAMAQLSQLMKDVNGDWTPDWMDNEEKHTIECLDGNIKLTIRINLAQFLSFPNREIRDKFAQDHKELIIEYFKIYQ